MSDCDTEKISVVCCVSWMTDMIVGIDKSC